MKKIRSKRILLFLLLMRVFTYAQVSVLTDIETVITKDILEINGSIAGVIKVVSSRYTAWDKDYVVIFSEVINSGTLTIKFTPVVSGLDRVYSLVSYIGAAYNTVAANPQVFSSLGCTTFKLKALLRAGRQFARLSGAVKLTIEGVCIQEIGVVAMAKVSLN